ncbi:hypothetical protein M0R45_015235 [Rubus argutus]|uniref:Uncharacterized protein n=1 Tax=Rubus argutus TaxID=59490 RepID=A0AAW1XNW2_RUBAR
MTLGTIEAVPGFFKNQDLATEQDADGSVVIDSQLWQCATVRQLVYTFKTVMESNLCRRRLCYVEMLELGKWQQHPPW